MDRQKMFSMTGDVLRSVAGLTLCLGVVTLLLAIVSLPGFRKVLLVGEEKVLCSELQEQSRFGSKLFWAPKGVQEKCAQLGIPLAQGTPTTAEGGLERFSPKEVTARDIY